MRQVPVFGYYRQGCLVQKEGVQGVFSLAEAPMERSCLSPKGWESVQDRMWIGIRSTHSKTSPGWQLLELSPSGMTVISHRWLLEFDIRLSIEALLASRCKKSQLITRWPRTEMSVFGSLISRESLSNCLEIPLFEPLLLEKKSRRDRDALNP